MKRQWTGIGILFRLRAVDQPSDQTRMKSRHRFVTIGRPSTGEGLYHRIVMEDGEIRTRRARVVVECSPSPRGGGVEVAVNLEAGEATDEQLGAAIQGMRMAAANGISRKLPLTDVRIEVVDVGFEPDESTVDACRMAGIFALVRAFELGGEVLVEDV